MKKKRNICVGSLVKNKSTGIVGSVIEIIGNPADPFGYVVSTEKGNQRWIIRKEQPKKTTQKD